VATLKKEARNESERLRLSRRGHENETARWLTNDYHSYAKEGEVSVRFEERTARLSQIRSTGLWEDVDETRKSSILDSALRRIAERAFEIKQHASCGENIALPTFASLSPSSLFATRNLHVHPFS
jgi:hypothetical protein